ncbi:MAG: hypothetical protein ACRDSJ_16495 [Rubrobacteraceae bacterium]
MRNGDSLWVLRGAKREFYVCATVALKGVAALCAFEEREGAERHLAGLTEFQMFLDTLDHHGANLPPWVNEESLMPRVVEVERRDVVRISHKIWVGYVAVNAPAAGAWIPALKVTPAKSFIANSERERRKNGLEE